MSYDLNDVFFFSFFLNNLFYKIKSKYNLLRVIKVLELSLLFKLKEINNL